VRKVAAERWVIWGMQKVALSAVGCVFNLSRGVQGWGWGRSKFQLRKFHKFCERKFNSIIKHFTKLIKLSKLKFINLSAFHVDCSYKPMLVQLSAVHTTLACTCLSVAMELSETMTTTIGLYYARIRSPVDPCLLWPRSPISATAKLLFMFYSMVAETVKITCKCCSVCSACMQCPLHERIVPNRPRRTGWLSMLCCDRNMLSDCIALCCSWTITIRPT